MTRPRVVYMNGTAPDKPTVRISRTQEGITFSITATGRSLNLARVRAEKAYRELAAFVAQQERMTGQIETTRRQGMKE